MRRLSPEETMRQLEAAVVEARTFFGIDPLYRTPLRANLGDGGAAKLTITHGYLFAPISVNLDYYQTSPELIREDIAHEIAHLMSAEVLAVRRRMPPEFQNEDDPRGGLLIDAIETLTVRLEHLFLRERPTPSDPAP